MQHALRRTSLTCIILNMIMVAKLVDAVPPGSYMAISILASDIQQEAQAEMTRRLNEGLPGITVTARSHAEVIRFFDGMELLEPGVVPPNYWRPGPGGPDPAREIPSYAAVGRKR